MITSQVRGFNQSIKVTMAKIFISSTFKDLKDYRKIVIETLRSTGHEIIALLEDGVAKNSYPLSYCLEKVSISDLYIGIFGFRYGTIPKGQDKSFTHLEFNQACKSKKTRLIFLADDDNYEGKQSAWSSGEEKCRIKNFRKKLRDERIVATFSTPEELANKVQTALLSSKEFISLYNKIEPSIEYELLASLCNRDEQEEIILKSIEKLIISKSRRPLFFVMPGDEKECHDLFIKRIKEDLIPNQLLKKTMRNKPRIQSVDTVLNQGSGYSLNSGIERHQELFRKIMRLGKNSNQRINSNIVNHRICCHDYFIISIICDMDIRRAETKNGIECFLKLWNDWPLLSPRTVLLVFFNISYKKNRNPFLKFFPISNDITISKFFQEKQESGVFKNIEEIIPLPELQPMNKEHIKKWVYKLKDMKFWEVTYKLRKIHTDLCTRLSLENEKDVIPSEKLMDELIDYLRNYPHNLRISEN